MQHGGTCVIPILKRFSILTRPFRRRTAPGATPGTITHDEDLKPPTITAVCYDKHEVEEFTVDDLEEIEEVLGRDYVTWINVEGIGDGQALRQIGELCKLHPLELEDIVHSHQRSKLDDYDDHLFIVGRMARQDTLESEQLAIVLGKGFVLTFQDGKPGDCLEPVRERLRKNQGRIRRYGADYLAYALFDAVVDGYFPVVEYYGDRIEDLDKDIAGSGLRDAIAHAHHLRSELLILRRTIMPHRETIAAWMRSEHDLISSDTHVFLRDAYDHTVHLSDLVGTYREMCTDLRDFFISLMNNRTNDVMKLLTIIATIFMPLSFIAGLYGMNFQYMPELTWRYGYPLVIVVMLLVAGALLGYIWRKGWFDL
jgi:magnesium transporter